MAHFKQGNKERWPITSSSLALLPLSVRRSSGLVGRIIKIKILTLAARTLRAPSYLA
jgi:hypothetical protein